MHGEDFFFQAFVFLMAAVVSVPVAKKLGLGSVLGYLIAGIAIGPYLLGLVGSESDDIMHYAEFGVVLMLFLIGLELQPQYLWQLRKRIFGLGGLQVIITTAAFTGIGLVFKLSLNQAIATGLILSLSSTAIVIQSLTEKGLLKNEAGQASFSVLLFQDMAVIPILAILPLLATQSAVSHEIADGAHSLPMGITGWKKLLLIVGVVTGIVVAGRFLAQYIFRVIANTGIREIFTAAALLIVIGIALAMSKIGVSPALGAFLAGVVLANNEYRHELETDIEPFKGLLLGLFFISVGVSINFNVLFNNPLIILLLLTILVSVKLLILYFLGKFFRLRGQHNTQFAFALAQAGEFAFVLISFGLKMSVLNAQLADLILLTVALSMAITPVLLIINDRVVSKYVTKKTNKPEDDIIDEKDNDVIIAGFGRFGLVVGRLLLANGIKVTILDSNPSNVEVLRKSGMKVYYGDVSRYDLLKSAGAENAKLILLSMQEKEQVMEIAKMVKNKFPHLKVAARAYDMQQVFEFYRQNVHLTQRETFNSAVEMGAKILHSLGYDRYHAYRAARTFKHHDDEVLKELYNHWFEDKNLFMAEARRFSEQLEDILRTEKEQSIHQHDISWDSTARREENIEETKKD